MTGSNIDVGCDSLAIIMVCVRGIAFVAIDVFDGGPHEAYQYTSLEINNKKFRAPIYEETKKHVSLKNLPGNCKQSMMIIWIFDLSVVHFNLSYARYLITPYFG